MKMNTKYSWILKVIMITILSTVLALAIDWFIFLITKDVNSIFYPLQ